MIAAMGLNPSVVSAQRRSLAMEANAATQPGAPAQQVAGIAGPDAAAAAAAMAPGAGVDAAGQAVLGAEAVQPPQTARIVLGSVIRGVVSGAGMMFGVNTLTKTFPGVGGFLTKIVSKIPLVSKFIPGFPIPKVLTVLGLGAVVGGIIGLISGLKKAKQAAADYAAAQAQQPPVDPNAGATPAPAPAPADPGNAPKNPEMGKDYRSPGAKPVKGAKHGPRSGSRKHHIVWGDTLWALSRRYGVSIDDIVKANPGKIKDPDLIYAGDTIVIPAAPRKKRAA